MAIEEQYINVITRLLDGVMFHEQMSIYYNFLGLKGFSKCHKYHYLSELHSYNCLLEYYINKYNKLINIKPNTDINIIPQNWYKFTKLDVDVSNIRGGIKTGLSKWLEWENETLNIFKESYKYVFDVDVTFGDLLKNLISDVEGEIKTINESILRNKATDYDIIVIMSEQDAYCKKYKNKIKHSIDFSYTGV